MTRIILADDHPMIHKGMTMLLNEYLQGITIDNVYNGKQLFDSLLKHPYDLLILDINMPYMSFSDFEQLRILYTDLKVLVYTQLLDQHFAVRYLKKGAFGFIHKSAPDEQLVSTVKTILNGKKYFSPEVMDQIINNISGVITENPFQQLSNREHSLIALLLDGLSLTEISQNMNLSMSAASTYKNRAFQKLGIDSIVDLVELSNQYLK